MPQLRRFTPGTEFKVGACSTGVKKNHSDAYHSHMDTSKPFGEACTANGGLKGAHEIEWVNDPDDDCAMTNSKSAGNKQSFINFTLIRQELTTSAVHLNYFGCIWCHHTRPELC